MTTPVNTTFIPGTTITSNWLNGVNDAINDSTQDIPNTIERTLPAKIAETVSVKDFGAVGDGVTDDTAAIQLAIDTVSAWHGTVLFPALPEGNSYKITTSLNVTKGIQLVGEGWQPSTSWNGTTTVRGAGSWIYVSDPTKPAIHVQRANGILVSGVLISDMAFIYDQPTPGVGFVPNDSDYCLKFTSADDCKVERVLTLNPGKALGITGIVGATSGRIDVDGLYGQPMYQGIFVDYTADICRINNVHFWPFWSDRTDVMNYTRDNSWFLISKRNDNMQGTNWFGYAMNGMRFQLGELGVTSRIKVSNIEFDNTKRAFFAGNSAAGATGQFCNFSAVANSTTAAADMFISTGDGVYFEWSNVRITNSQDSSIRVTGNNAIHKFSNLYCEDWNLSSGGTLLFPAIYCGANCYVYVTSPSFRDVAASGAPKYAGSGTIVTSRDYKTWTGVLDSAGNANIIHQISDLVNRVTNTSGFFLDGTNWETMPVGYMNNTYIQFEAPGMTSDAGKAYRVVVEYTA